MKKIMCDATNHLFKKEFYSIKMLKLERIKISNP